MSCSRALSTLRWHAHGTDHYGPIAVIGFQAKIDRTGGTLLKKLTPHLLDGSDGIDHLAHRYFRINGHHIQFNGSGRAISL